MFADSRSQEDVAPRSGANPDDAGAALPRGKVNRPNSGIAGIVGNRSGRPASTVVQGSKIESPVASRGGARDGKTSGRGGRAGSGFLRGAQLKVIKNH